MNFSTKILLLKYQIYSRLLILLKILILSFPPIMFAFIAANFNAKLKLVRSRTQDPSGMSTAGGNSSRNGSIKEKVYRTVRPSMKRSPDIGI